MNTKTCKDCPCYEPYPNYKYHAPMHDGHCWLDPPSYSGFDTVLQQHNWEPTRTFQDWWCYRGREIMEKLSAKKDKGLQRDAIEKLGRENPVNKT